MRNTCSHLTGLALIALLAPGCARMQTKFGRGLSNTFEVVRAGEVRRSMEQTALFESPNAAYTTGFVRGLSKTVVRTGVGLYEIVTSPFPPYDPVLTRYISPEAVYPDSYKPGLVAGSTFATDTYLGFSGGDVMPFVPGSRFEIFGTH